MIDLRDLSEFQLFRIESSSHFPLKYFYQNMWSSLPPQKSRQLILIGHQFQIKEARQILEKYNWNIEKCIDIDELKDDYNIEYNKKDYGQRLWKPNPVLFQEILLIEQKLNKQNLKVVDLGCGRGRDSIFLSQRGWDVTSIDNQQAFLDALKNWQEVQNIKPINYILQNFKNNLYLDHFDLYVFSRFMNYQLLDQIIIQMEKFSFILVCHFLEEKSQNSKGNKFKQKNQLINSQFFEKFQDFDIIKNEQVSDESGKRLLCYFLAQKIS